MFNYIILIQFFMNLVSCRNSPNGADFIAYLSPQIKENISQDILEDTLLDATGIITKYKYPVEEHEVKTEDGYILGLFRIPKEGGIPVLMVHGLLGSVADWVMNKADLALAFILHDYGYDVWLANSRGNYYSRKHETLDPENSPFWNFDWHEIGYYDLPALIDFILEKTGRSKLHYVGHSQGCTAFFVMTTTRTDYNDKILSMQALAPSVYFLKTRFALLLRFSRYIETLQKALLVIGTGEISPTIDIRRKITAKYCYDNSTMSNFCMTLMYGDHDYMNMSRVPIYIAHNPAGASVRQLTHFAQLYNTGKFQQYDHGDDENFRLYQNHIPPLYNLSLVSAPVALHYSNNDEMFDITSVDRLHSELGNSIGKFLVERESFTHLDFITGIDCKEQVYDKAMELMKQYE